MEGILGGLTGSWRLVSGQSVPGSRATNGSRDGAALGEVALVKTRAVGMGVTLRNEGHLGQDLWLSRGSST